jgi:hypothetical protein
LLTYKNFREPQKAYERTKRKMPEKNGEDLPTVNLLKSGNHNPGRTPETRLIEGIEQAGGNYDKVKEAIFKYFGGFEEDELASKLDILERLKKMENQGNPENQDRQVFGSSYEIDLLKEKMENVIFRYKEKNKDSSIEEVAGDLQNLMVGILEEVQANRYHSPTKQLSVALSALSKLEKREFVLSNMLEQLKKGEDYYKILERFNNLGITDIEIPEEQEEQTPNNEGKGSGIVRGLKALRDFGKAVVQIVISLINSIPDLIQLKPRIGVAGTFVPTISFEVEPKSQTAKQLYNLLTKYK